MAPSLTQNTETSILTLDYVAQLRSLCIITDPSVDEIIAMFKVFRRVLDVRKPKSTSTSSSTSKKRGGRLAPRSTVVGDDPGFERSCTWEPDQAPCWIVSDLELWNRILARNCIELREYTWGELSLRDYQLSETMPEFCDVLQASLLIHVLLRQHRCVTRIIMDMAVTTLETRIFWHALNTGAARVKKLEYWQNFLELKGLMLLVERNNFCEAVAALKKLTWLCLSGICFNDEIVETLGGCVEQSIALSVLELIEIQVDDTDAGVFLDHVARNRSLKSICTRRCFLVARKGKALADVVRNHVTLEKIEVKGDSEFSPSALLKAVVQSNTLRSLTVHECRIEVEDIEALASALSVNPLPRGLHTQTSPSPPRFRLEKLAFKSCKRCTGSLEAAYAKLIGGGLLYLELSDCGLGSVFAMAAGFRLYFDKRLLELKVPNNTFPIGPLRSLIGALEFNKSLTAMVLEMTAQHPPERLSALFTMIHSINALSRLKLQWIYPRASDFLNSALAVHTPSAHVKLEGCGHKEVVQYLDAVARNPNIDVAVIDCWTPAEPAIVQRLAECLATTKSLRNLFLNVSLADADVAHLFSALERNRTIDVLDIRRVTFSKRNAHALRRLVENSRTLVFLTIDLRCSGTDADRMVQSRRIHQELKEAVRRNRFITCLNVIGGTRDDAVVIMEYLRRNAMLVNQALRFVDGSTKKADALAFETLQHCESLQIRLQLNFEVSQESAAKTVAESRRRLAFDYFILAGIVKAKVVCQRNRKAKKKKNTLFDNLGRDLQACICSYLSLRDVIDV